MTVRVRVCLAILIVAASACSPHPDARDVSTGRADQSGEVVAEIGVIEGPEEFVFGRIVGVAADPAGHVYVLDEQTSDLRVYSPSGDFLKVVAREGDGPGSARSHRPLRSSARASAAPSPFSSLPQRPDEIRRLSPSVRRTRCVSSRSSPPS